jgi:hypothetical protein
MIWRLPHSPPASHYSKLALFLSLPVCVVGGANEPMARKPGPLQLIQYSLLFCFLGGFFVEAGSNDAESRSDSLHFELSRGWKVYER